MDTQNSFDILRRLHKNGSPECIEWSITISRDAVQHRHKPTLYLYQGTGFERYRDVAGFLCELGCPRNVIELHKKYSHVCTYQAFRMSSVGMMEKTLYIRPAAHRYLEGYRWRDTSAHDIIHYPHKNISLEEVKPFIHPWFRDVVISMQEQREFEQQSGVWLQEYNDDVYEIYPLFPGRTGFNWIMRSLQDHVSETVMAELLPLQKLRTSVMGFTTLRKEPEMTVYFSVPTSSKFPNNYDEAVSMTLDFFNAS